MALQAILLLRAMVILQRSPRATLIPLTPIMKAKIALTIVTYHYSYDDMVAHHLSN